MKVIVEVTADDMREAVLKSVYARNPILLKKQIGKAEIDYTFSNDGKCTATVTFVVESFASSRSKMGRPQSIDPDKVRELQLRGLKPAAIAEELNVSVPSVYRILAAKEK